MLGITKTINGNGFESVFQEITHTETLDLKNANCLRLFCLDISNNQFSYVGLHQFLQKNIGRYVFSRATIDKLTQDGEAEAIGLKAVELLRTAANPKDKGAGGELGEILLYLFLEQKLNAPKLLSKVELKTTDNQYVFGSDAIHFLPIDNKLFQLVLGESKIRGDLKSAVDDAFVSIIKAISSADNELRLIERNILSESFDAQTTQLITSLLVPTKRDHHLFVDNAFGIFLGYTLGLDAQEYSNTEYRNALSQKVDSDIRKIAEYLKTKINETKLTGYSFYIYILPFNDAPNDRAAIIKQLKGEK